MKQGSRNLSGGGTRTGSVLVGAEVALSVVLPAGAGLLIRSLLILRSVDPGFDPNSVISMRVSLPSKKYETPESRAAFFERALQRVRALSGVESATGSSFLPGTPLISGTSYQVQGRPGAEPGQHPVTQTTSVDANFFRSMRVRLLKERLFSERDNSTSAPLAFIVNEAFAKSAFAGEDPIGKRISVAMARENSFGEIVGVAAYIRHAGLTNDVRPTAYYSYSKLAIPMMHLLVRTADHPAGVGRAVAFEIRCLDPEVPVADVMPMEEVLADSIARVRFTTLVLGVFSALALALAAVGLCGVLSCSVTQRTSEIGIRMAPGAQPRDVLRLILRNVFALVAAGLALGLASASAATRLRKTLLFGVEPHDLLILLAVCCVLLGSSAAAAWWPVRRACRVDPMIALRYE